MFRIRNSFISHVSGNICASNSSGWHIETENLLHSYWQQAHIYHLCRRVHRTQWGNSHRSIRCTAPHMSLHSCSASRNCCSGPGSLDSPLQPPLPSPPGQWSHRLSSEPACSPGNPSDHSRLLVIKIRSRANVQAEQRILQLLQSLDHSQLCESYHYMQRGQFASSLCTSDVQYFDIIDFKHTIYHFCC